MELITNPNEILSSMNELVLEHKSIRDSENIPLLSKAVAADMYILASYFISPHIIEEIAEIHTIDDASIDLILDGEIRFNEKTEMTDYMRFFADLYIAADELDSNHLWSTQPLIHKIAELDLLSSLANVQYSLNKYEEANGSIIASWQLKKNRKTMQTALKSYDVALKNNIDNPLLSIKFPETPVFSGGESNLYELSNRTFEESKFFDQLFYDSIHRLNF